MHLITALRDVQIPLLAAMLLGGFVTKLVRIARLRSVGAGLGPTALFPMRLRRPLALAMCAVELGLGAGLIATSGTLAGSAPATCVRLGTALLFLVAAAALVELRASRPDLGCGCFGDLSSTPVNWRTMARPGLLAVAALSTIGLGPVALPRPGWDAAGQLGLLAAEVAVIAFLSPELNEALIRLGYTEPCELRVVPVERSLAALRRSKQWRRHAGVLTADQPEDTWRELCWRYLVFPGRHGDTEVRVVFAVFLRQRRPAVHAALVDAVTGRPLPWPAPPAGPELPARRWPAIPAGRPAEPAYPALSSVRPRRRHRHDSHPPGALPLSNDL
jgi:hypothetical protein